MAPLRDAHRLCSGARAGVLLIERRMQNVSEGKGRSLRRRRRALWIVALALLRVALEIAALQVARVAAERKLSAALGTPVTIGTVWWLPWNGTLTANRVTI